MYSTMYTVKMDRKVGWFLLWVEPEIKQYRTKRRSPLKKKKFRPIYVYIYIYAKNIFVYKK